MKHQFKKQYGPFALIAGASQGIGEAFAREIARRGVNVILISRRKNELEKIANEIMDEFAIKALPIVLDLTQENVECEIKKIVTSYEINLLVYNAALSPIGSFFNPSLTTHREVIKLNCRGPMEWSYRLIPDMCKRGHGGVILMSSLTAFQGSPFVAHYGATKAYNLSLAEALWDECRAFNVHVMAVTAGATSTPNFIASKPRINNIIKPPIQSPQEVAEQSLNALHRNIPFFIPGWKNRLSSFVLRKLLPRSWAIKLIGQMNRKMYDHESEKKQLAQKK
ncbi:SDR family NAD(P)-dependent oxidoreductase [Candidatus Lokiarchaeum ossiferum]|uniref:SDR family NAD(P)-dependent oxidoreductase n=1 Tax=Candidatus Lokiarchaeum ossiferum TaxID=2951803 RepID=UPI00352DD2F0